MLSGPSLCTERLAAERGALVELAASQLAAAPARVRVRYELRYRGQSFELAIEPPGADDPRRLEDAFASEHELRYGYRDASAAVELVNDPRVRVGAGARAAPARRRRARKPRETTGVVRFDSRDVEARVLVGALPEGMRVSGPSLCALPDSTLFVPPGWSGVGRRLRDAACWSASDERARPDRAAGAHRRAAGGLPGDGRRARARRPLREHQGAPRRLDGAVRPRRARW